MFLKLQDLFRKKSKVFSLIFLFAEFCAKASFDEHIYRVNNEKKYDINSECYEHRCKLSTVDLGAVFNNKGYGINYIHNEDVNEAHPCRHHGCEAKGIFEAEGRAL